MAMQMREERPGHSSSGSDGNPDDGETQCLPMWDKGSTDTMAHCPVLLLWKMEWREMAGVRPAAGSVLRKLYSRGGPLICVEQATFVLYLHSCRIGWNELWTVLNYFGLQRGWWGGGPRCKWNPRSLEPQKPEFVSVFSWKRSLCQHGKPGWECAWPQQGHQGQLEREGRKDPEQSFTGVHTNTVPSFMHDNWGCWNRKHAV